jgi:hypothetical protein
MAGIGWAWGDVIEPDPPRPAFDSVALPQTRRTRYPTGYGQRAGPGEVLESRRTKVKTENRNHVRTRNMI